MDLSSKEISILPTMDAHSTDNSISTTPWITHGRDTESFVKEDREGCLVPPDCEEDILPLGSIFSDTLPVDAGRANRIY